jgi:hypothetical protein
MATRFSSSGRLTLRDKPEHAQVLSDVVRDIQVAPAAPQRVLGVRDARH